MVMNMLWDFVNTGVHSVLLWIDSVIYWFASECYQLFVKLAGARIFEDNFFANFANRIYVVLGVFMLFYLAYALLNALVDPDKLTKGDKGAGKIATNLIVSLVILGFLPTIFSYAYRLQNYVLASNVIGSLVLGTPVQETTGQNNNDSMIGYGDVISFTVLNTFLNPDNINFNITNNYTWYDFKASVLDDGDYSAMPNMGKAVSTGVSALNGENSGSTIRIDYKVGISTAAGIFLIYIMISFTLDLGMRVAKFAFYQLIAPIPVIMRILPSKKGVFDKWLKQTLSIYFEVFIRVAAMYIAIYFINALVNSNTLSQFWNGGIQGKLALVIIIMGIFAFAKQIPKIIGDMLGLEKGSLSLGIMDKLKTGGLLGIGAVLGAGATSMVRNATQGVFNTFGNLRKIPAAFRNNGAKGGFKQVGQTALSFGSGLGSTFAGTTSGMFNAYKSAKDAKNFRDVKNAASAGAKASYENRKKRENYIAINNGLRGSAVAKAQGILSGAKEWATGTGFSDFLSQIDFKDRFLKEFDEYKNLYNNAEYQAMNDQLNKYQAILAANPNAMDNGESVKNLANNLRNAMREKRATAINKNSEAAAYVAYNLAKFAQDNYSEFKKSGIDFNNVQIDDFVLKGNKVYHKNGNEYSAGDILKMFENIDVNNPNEFEGDYTPNGAIKLKLRDGTTVQVSDESAGMNKKMRDVKHSLTAEKQSAAYKEAQKRKEIEQSSKK